MSSRSVAKGAKFDLQFARDAHGRYPAEQFLADLEPDRAAERAGLFALFQRFAEHGVIRNPEQFKPLKDTDPALVEFKKGQARVFAFYNGAGVVVLTHGTIKKKDRLDPAEIDRAHRIRTEHLSH